MKRTCHYEGSPQPPPPREGLAEDKAAVESLEEDGHHQERSRTKLETPTVKSRLEAVVRTEASRLVEADWRARLKRWNISRLHTTMHRTPRTFKGMRI